jgi:glycosyltransferase involved in cell wall biosynthesis
MVQACVALCATSLYEGFPVALLDAMAAGLPGVSFDCKGGAARKDSSRRGRRARSGGRRLALAKAMGALINDERLRAEMAGHAIVVRKRFSKERVLALWDAAFKPACGTCSVARE